MTQTFTQPLEGWGIVIRKVLFRTSLSIGITGKLVPIVLAAYDPIVGAQQTQAQPYVCQPLTPRHVPLAARDSWFPQLFCLPDPSLAQLQKQGKYKLNIC